ncbi:hypothetical protein [Taylorella equigenitalis]|uniref:Uncharacterized protein n=1 Tax=Taylorella equigenitalis ATCC 35865 TaxID=743973 RepID=A0ABN4AX98_9BURK|nr:hypothetical protein [Taylorella equigenitalis]AFN35215.1 hypothetical protein KUI_0113 [Taylorella equigenitalis ATCC 35865]ASY38659.1 hypothetical protein CA604_00560 [Taylorella equigenitalis]
MMAGNYTENILNNLETQVIEGNLTHSVNTGTRYTKVKLLEKNTFSNRRELYIFNGQTTRISGGEEHKVFDGNQTINIESGSQKITVVEGNRTLDVKSANSDCFKDYRQTISGETNRTFRGQTSDKIGGIHVVDVLKKTTIEMDSLDETVKSSAAKYTSDSGYTEKTKNFWKTSVNSGEANIKSTSRINISSNSIIDILGTSAIDYQTNLYLLLAFLNVEAGEIKKDNVKFCITSRIGCEAKVAEVQLTQYAWKIDKMVHKNDFKIVEKKEEALKNTNKIAGIELSIVMISIFGFSLLN